MHRTSYSSSMHTHIYCHGKIARCLSSVTALIIGTHRNSAIAGATGYKLSFFVKTYAVDLLSM